jgi:hypothetical protein
MLSLNAMYVRHTRAIEMNELRADVLDKLTSYAAAQQIDLSGVRMWITHSENPPSNTLFGKMLRRRANPADSEPEHSDVVVLHPTQLIVVGDGPKRGISALAIPLARASVTRGIGIIAKMGLAEAGEADGFSVTGVPVAGSEGAGIGSIYIGTGPEPAAAECFSAIQSAIAAAKTSKSE